MSGGRDSAQAWDSSHPGVAKTEDLCAGVKVDTRTIRLVSVQNRLRNAFSIYSRPRPCLLLSDSPTTCPSLPLPFDLELQVHSWDQLQTHHDLRRQGFKLSAMLSEKCLFWQQDFRTALICGQEEHRPGRRNSLLEVRREPVHESRKGLGLELGRIPAASYRFLGWKSGWDWILWPAPVDRLVFPVKTKNLQNLSDLILG